MGSKIQQNQSFVTGVACFSQLSEPLGPFDRAMQVMEMLAESGYGLGEVLKDYARQTHEQMGDLLQACESLLRADVSADTAQSLAAAYNVLSSAATVLDMTPSAMSRNQAEALGGRERISREEIVRITRAFKQAPEVMALLQSPEACHALVVRALTEKNAGDFLPAIAAMQSGNASIHHSA